ncbi:GrpB family protein [Listeria booriae]|uniref:GrpB family protein n=1 Tax=Listeria booriae TaxID=1552123 RepID=UPI0016271885|nr:GrpB family protein [Listeria booriae]MBC1898141.1 GrpB family protein [Listeria booriae]MBC2099550.1 GrpB family protein [Listeria booriae]
MKIQVVAYSNTWPAIYQNESEQISAILEDNLVAIHHIGSTSVPGLQAKPIIDIMPVVRNITAVDAHNNAFEKLGYECMGEFGMPGRRYFRKGSETRTHHIHIFEEANQVDITRHLAVRDYLRTHQDVANAYGELKAKLALEYPDDIDGYCDGKDAFVKEMERAAVRWRTSH